MNTFVKHVVSNAIGTAVNGFLVYLATDLRFWACVLCGYLMSEIISSASTIADLKEELDVVRGQLGRIHEKLYRSNDWSG